MKILLTTILIILLITLLTFAETTLSLELYPDRMDNLLDSNQGLANGQEWFATSVKVEKTFFEQLNLNIEIKTFLFGTNGFSYYPSSVKFTNSISYQFDHFKVEYEHYCHHYLKQYPKNLRSEQSKITFEYSF